MTCANMLDFAVRAPTSGVRASAIGRPESIGPGPRGLDGGAVRGRDDGDEAGKSGRVEDPVSLSPEALAKAGEPNEGTEQVDNPQELSDEERQQVQELQRRDAEVRAHEQAHASRGGSFAGSPTYEYETGPDGRRYAVGGEVSIDVAPVAGNPEATVRKMQAVHAAAMAPAEPSGQDRSVAAAAAQELAKAKAEVISGKAGEDGHDGTETSSADPREQNVPRGVEAEPGENAIASAAESGGDDSSQAPPVHHGVRRYGAVAALSESSVAAGRHVAAVA